VREREHKEGGSEREERELGRREREGERERWRGKRWGDRERKLGKGKAVQ
jgi:hypothetical protein